MAAESLDGVVDFQRELDFPRVVVWYRLITDVDSEETRASSLSSTLPRGGVVSAAKDGMLTEQGVTRADLFNYTLYRIDQTRSKTEEMKNKRSNTELPTQIQYTMNIST